ncbi:MAG: restriction endonuclease [Candidatus Microsaccharimonas sp.]
MARRYRRYNKRNEDPLAGILGLATLAGGLWFWQASRENQALLIAGIALLVFLVIGAGGLIFWKYRRTQQKIRALDIAAIDSMDPLLFEEYVAKLLRYRGYTSVALTAQYDLGVDIVAEKDGVRWGVQVKRYKNTVKAEAVRQVFTALVRYKCDRAMVVTNSDYSRPARILADDNNCVLVNRDQLAEWIVDFQSNTPPNNAVVNRV